MLRDMKELEPFGRLMLAKDLGKITYAVRKELDSISKTLDVERKQIEICFVRGFIDICQQNPDDEFEDEEDE